MAVIDHDGIFDASKGYSHKAIARIIGRTERWVIQQVIRDDVKFRKIGNLYMVSGHELILWIERTSDTWQEGDEINEGE
ncbi:MAG: hypothetical protein AAGA92_02165 [Planctomycetota bacterium]